MNDTTKILRYNIPDGRRIIAASDIHGHCTFLKELLKKVEFSQRDELFLCGDYIERGTENLEALRYVMKLSEQENVHTICGNVDSWRTAVIAGGAESPKDTFDYIKHKKEYYGTCTITEMCDEIGIKIQCPQDIPRALELIRVHFKKELDFIDTLPTIIDTQNFTFVHGGLMSANIEDAQNIPAHRLKKFDGFLYTDIHFNKYVIVGHWPTSIYRDLPDCSPLILSDKKIIDIDGGCGVKKYGQLNGLIIPNVNSEEFSYESYDNFPIITASKSTAQSTDFLNIKWINNKINVLEKGKNFSKILHISENKVGFVPSSFIYKDEDGFHCRDYCDFKPSVTIGEKLKLTEEFDFGYFIKKGSTFGLIKK